MIADFQRAQALYLARYDAVMRNIRDRLVGGEVNGNDLHRAFNNAASSMLNLNSVALEAEHLLRAAMNEEAKAGV